MPVACDSLIDNTVWLCLSPAVQITTATAAAACPLIDIALIENKTGIVIVMAGIAESEYYYNS